ncbi:hypothetical protein E2562_021933 [Oryza meyeriana var. granulata]|uniref:Uncharacterized protein n=1 Tax=Oryza meyeriana var. granulata TaxID=110450 RepID=A0A6G1DLJ8_9ORYZ|nr:hypothetical protein E2562_021933 [Oryza meyeriana var. granulata]
MAGLELGKSIHRHLDGLGKGKLERREGIRESYAADRLRLRLGSFSALCDGSGPTRDPATRV